MLDVITSTALAPLPHGFFGRKGGASTGVFYGLNCGLGSADQAEIVAINRARAAKALGLNADRLATPHQSHSAIAVTIDDVPALPPDSDALVTASRGLAIGVLTADCAPVLFADHKAGIIGAAHAGWKGALGGVLEATVETMRALGAEQIRAVIGPLISERFYEVGPEFQRRFMEDSQTSGEFFSEGKGDRLQFDLAGYVMARLHREGVEAHWTGHCTYRDAERFFSYRRSGHQGEKDYGRMLSAISLGG